MIKRLKNALTTEITTPAFPDPTSNMRWIIWCYAGLFLFIPLPWITPLQLYGNSDALFYTNILTFIKERLHHGEIFPRWFSDANGGMGSAVMLFYAPLSYTLTALINAPFSWLDLKIGPQFLLGIYTSQVAAGFTSYVWLNRQFSKRIAFIGSLMYVLLPYKLIYIYLHFNLAQLWALVFLPVWMQSAEEICEDIKASPALYALALSATYYCHPLTVLAFGLIPLCYVLLMAPAGRRIACYMRLVIANILAIGICLWQAYPQFAWLDWIHNDEFLKGRLHWEGNFFHLDVFLCFYYGLVAFVICYGALRLPSVFTSVTRRTIFFWGSVIAITAFMTQRVSNPLWEHIVMLQYLQFPAARLHAGALLGVTYLFCIWINHTKELSPLGPALYRPSMIILCILFFGAITVCRVKNLYTDGTLVNKDYVGEAQYAQIIPVPEYKTSWGCGDGIKAITLYRSHTMPPLVEVKEGKAILHKIRWDPPQLIIVNMDVISPSSGIVLRQCYVPLWQATDEKKQQITITPTLENGFMEISLPKGPHEVTLSIAPTAQFKNARSVSLACLLACMGWLLSRIGRRQTVALSNAKENT